MNSSIINSKPCSYGYIIQIYYNTQTVIRNVLLFLTNLNFPTKKKLHEEKKKKCRFCCNTYWKRGSARSRYLGYCFSNISIQKMIIIRRYLKYSVKVTDTDKIKEVRIDIGKPIEKPEVVAELYKSEIPSDNKFWGTYVKEI